MKKRMRRILQTLFCGLLWLAAGSAGLLEGVLVGYWLWGAAYLDQYGAANNPYVREDTSLMAVFALLLLPIFLGFLIFALSFTRYCLRRRARLENEISD